MQGSSRCGCSGQRIEQVQQIEQVLQIEQVQQIEQPWRIMSAEEVLQPKDCAHCSCRRSSAEGGRARRGAWERAVEPGFGFLAALRPLLHRF